MTQNNTEQMAKFKEAAREVEADESGDALDLIMSKLDLTKKTEATPPATGPQSSDRRR